MPVKARRTVDDIFDDLDNIGKRKPSLAELYPEEFEPLSIDVASSTTSPAPNQKRTSSTSCAQSQTPPAGEVPMLDSSCQRIKPAAATPMTICGSPSFSDVDAVESPAFASELTTMHRRTEGAADLAVFLADSVHRSPTALGLTQVVEHLCAFEGRFVIRALCVGGLTRPFLHGLLKDYRYESLRSAAYKGQLLLLLKTILAHIPHDSVPMDDVFGTLIRVVAPLGSQPTAGPVSPVAVQPKKAAVGFAASVAKVAQKRARDESEKQSPQAGDASLTAVDDAAATMQLTAAVRNLIVQLGDGSEGDCDREGVSPSTCACGIEALALNIMTELLLSLNHQASEGEDGFAVRSLSNLISKTTAVYFVNARGLEGILQFLSSVVARADAGGDRLVSVRSMETIVVAALRLIVLVTCDPSFASAVAPSRDGGDEYQRTLGRLMQLAIHVDEWCGDNLDVQTEAVRVCINITSALPALIPKTRTSFLEDACHRIQRSVKQLDAEAASSAAQSLSSSALGDDGDGGYDVATLRICLSINLLQRGKNAQMVRTLTRLGDDEPEEVLGSSFLARSAALMVRWYEAEDTGRSVIAGYLAMMLACISLCDSAEVDFRVAVITAISRALVTAPGNSPTATFQEAVEGEESDNTAAASSQNTTKGKQLKAKPMMLVVAVLQEFIMFQSAAGILTKEVLISMHQVIEKLIERNNIVVERE